jgi:hypothetical protein
MNTSRRKVPAILAIAALLVAILPRFVQAQTPAAQPAAAPVLVAKIAANLSTKSAKVGDAIVAKTVKAYKLTDGTSIPKGSKVTGKVATVQSKKAGNGNSMMTFRLDQIEVKGGAAIPIQGLVVAIGPSMAPKDLFGANSVMGRNTNPQSGTGVTAASKGTGSSNGLDPNTGLGSSGAKDENDIPLGSTLEGVALGRHMDADWTTALQGIKTDIDLDSDVVIKVELK